MCVDVRAVTLFFLPAVEHNEHIAKKPGHSLPRPRKVWANGSPGSSGGVLADIVGDVED